MRIDRLEHGGVQALSIAVVDHVSAGHADDAGGVAAGQFDVVDVHDDGNAGGAALHGQQFHDFDRRLRVQR